MTLRKKINEQFNAALKSKNKTFVSTFRLILAAIKERDIANRSGGKKEETKILSLLLKAVLNCSFIFSRNVMIYKNVNLLYSSNFFKRKKFHLYEIKYFSYVASNQVL